MFKHKNEIMTGLTKFDKNWDKKTILTFIFFIV